MKIFTILILTIITVSLISCKKDKEGSLDLYFHATYDDQPLTMFSTVDGTGPEQLQFTHFSFFASDIALLDGASETGLSDVELIDLSYDLLTDAEEGFLVRINDIPAGGYDGIRFGIGVPPDNNAKEPADFASANPLSRTSYYWEAWSSYIFSKIEGRLDSLGNDNFDLPFALHTGADALYRILEGNLPLTIEESKSTTLHVSIDLKDLLTGVDIRSNPQNHNPADSIQIGRIVNNIATSVVLYP